MNIKNNLTSQEVCEIIKQCGESGVVNFNFRELHVTFQDREEQRQDPPQIQSPGQVTANTEILDEKSLIQQDEATAKELELEELKIQNPFEDENMLCQSECEEGK